MKSKMFALIAIVGALAPGARAADVPARMFVISGGTYVPGDHAAGTPTLILLAGSSLTLSNLDTKNTHTVTAQTVSPEGAPLFDTGSVSHGEDGEVRGVAGLAPGGYPFYCVNHPDMAGTLQIVDM